MEYEKGRGIQPHRKLSQMTVDRAQGQEKNLSRTLPHNHDIRVDENRCEGLFVTFIFRSKLDPLCCFLFEFPEPY